VKHLAALAIVWTLSCDPGSNIRQTAANPETNLIPVYTSGTVRLSSLTARATENRLTLELTGHIWGPLKDWHRAFKQLRQSDATSHSAEKNGYSIKVTSSSDVSILGRKFSIELSAAGHFDPKCVDLTPIMAGAQLWSIVWDDVDLGTSIVLAFDSQPSKSKHNIAGVTAFPRSQNTFYVSFGKSAVTLGPIPHSEDDDESGVAPLNGGAYLIGLNIDESDVGQGCARRLIKVR